MIFITDCNVCLYLHRFSFHDLHESPEAVFLFLVNLSIGAAEYDSATGENFSELLFSVCNYNTFPLSYENITEQADILLDLYSYMIQYVAKNGISLPPVFKKVYQSVPAVWSIDLSKRKASILLEVLKMQTRPVELKGLSDEMREIRNILQCLPYISQLR